LGKTDHNKEDILDQLFLLVKLRLMKDIVEKDITGNGMEYVVDLLNIVYRKGKVK